MKKFAQILIVLALLFAAGQVWAIEIKRDNGTVDHNVGPETLLNYSDSEIENSISLTTPGSNDRGALQSEKLARTYPAGISRESARIIYANSFFGRNGYQFIFDSAGNLDPTHSSTGTGTSKTPDLPECSFSLSGLACGMMRVIAGLLHALVYLLSFLANIANQIFNYSIDVSVRGFNRYTDLPGVRQAWSLCRNLVNISFIFVLLYVAFGTILQLGSVNGKRLLKNVIIAALLVNFSFFFTSIIIDASNVVANTFYSLAAAGHPSGWRNAPDIVTPLVDASRQGTESRFVMEWGVKNSNDSLTNQFGSIIGSYVGQIILMLVTTTVLFAGAFMFFARTIVLILVLVLSPLAFLGFAVGGELSKLSSKWRDALSGQVIFAPVYLLLIYMTVQLVTSGGGLRALVDAGDGGGLISSLTVFAIVNGLMIGSLLVAKQLGVAGAAAATKLGGSLTGFGARLIGRPIGGAIGYGYGRIRDKINPKDQTTGERKYDVGGKFNRLVLKAKSYPVTKEIAETLVGGGGGIRQAIKTAYTKPGQVINEGIKDVTGVAILGQTVDEERERRKREKDEKEERDTEKRKETELELQKIAGSTRKETITRPLTTEEKTKQEEDKKKVQEVSNKNIVKIDPDTLVKLAHLLSESQMKALSDGKDGIDPKQYTKIKVARESLLKEALSTNNRTIIKQEIDEMSNEALGNFIADLSESEFNDDTVDAIARNISEKVVEELAKKGGARRPRIARIASRFPSGISSAGAQVGTTRTRVNQTNNPARPTNPNPPPTRGVA